MSLFKHLLLLILNGEVLSFLKEPILACILADKVDMTRRCALFILNEISLYEMYVLYEVRASTNFEYSTSTSDVTHA